MSKRRTLSSKTLTNRHVVRMLNEQTENLTQCHFTKKGAYRKIYAILSEVGKDSIRCLFSGGSPCKPNFKSPNWKKNFANEVGTIIINGGFESLVPTYIEKIKEEFPKAVGDNAEMESCYYKVASYCGQASLMISYGLDPDLLIMSP